MICRCRSRGQQRWQIPYWRGWGVRRTVLPPKCADLLSTRSGAMQNRCARARCRWAVDDHRPLGRRPAAHLGSCPFLESQGAESHDVQFRGLATIDAAQGTLRRDFEFCEPGARYERMWGLVPTIAWHPTQKRWLLLPENFAGSAMVSPTAFRDGPTRWVVGRCPGFDASSPSRPTWRRPGRPASTPGLPWVTEAVAHRRSLRIYSWPRAF